MGADIRDETTRNHDDVSELWAEDREEEVEGGELEDSQEVRT